MTDATLDERLRDGVYELLEGCPSKADWDGVLRAATRPAGVRPGTRRRTPRLWRSLLIATALVLVGGSIAFALADRLVEELTGGPVPPTVETFMTSVSGPDGSAAGTIVPGSAHLTVTLATKRFGVVQLYSARTTRGVCEVIVRDGRPSGQCSVDRRATGSPVVFGYGGTPEKPGSNLIDGHTVSPAGTSLRIRFRRGPSRTVAVHDRIFLIELGPDHSQRSRNPPVAFDVLDAAGHIIGTRRDPLRVEGRSLLGTVPVATTVHTIASARLPRGQGHVAILGGRDARNRPCFRFLVNGNASVFPTWVCNASVGRYGHEIDPDRPTSLRRIPVSWTRSGTFVSGWVAPRVTRLEMRFEDGSTATVALHRRYFLYVIRPGKWSLGHLPTEVRAYAGGDKPIYRQALPPVALCDNGYPCGNGTGGVISLAPNG